MNRIAFRGAAGLIVAVLVAGAAHSEELADGGPTSAMIVNAPIESAVAEQVQRQDDMGAAEPAVAQPRAWVGLFDVLDLGSRGRLHGRLRAVETGEDLLQWDNPSAHSTLDFPLKNKRGVMLGERLQQGAKPSPATLWFANGDLIHGQVKAITPEIILFDTWYAGTLEIPRNMVRRLVPGVTGGTIIYDGPVEVANWHQSSGEQGWRYEGGILSAHGFNPLGRRFAGLPELCHFYFDISWTGNLKFIFSFYAEDEKIYSRNAYALRFDGNSVQPLHFDDHGQSRAIGDRVRSDLLEPAPEGRKARVSLYVNKESGEIAVDINGGTVGVWSDGNRPAPAGEAVVIQQLMLGLAIHDMRIEQWSGAVPREEDAYVKSRTDVLSMTNNDRVSGRLLSMTGDSIRFESAFATIDVPASWVRTIQFMTVALEPPREGVHPTRANFTSDGHLTFDLLRIAADQVEGRSDAIGLFSMPLSALRSLQFGPQENPSTKHPSTQSLVAAQPDVRGRGTSDGMDGLRMRNLEGIRMR